MVEDALSEDIRNRLALIGQKPIMHGYLTLRMMQLRDAGHINYTGFQTLLEITRRGVYPEGAGPKERRIIMDEQAKNPSPTVGKCSECGGPVAVVGLARQVQEKMAADAVQAGAADSMWHDKAPGDRVGTFLRNDEANLGVATNSAKPSDSFLRNPHDITEVAGAKVLNVLDSTSASYLQHVKPGLAAVVALANALSIFPIRVTDGLRTLVKQRENVAKGVSKTMHSMHLPQADGLSWAVDVVAMVNDRPSWEWQHVFFVTMAMDKAATQLNLAHNIRWGGAWDRRLSDFGGNEEAYKQVCLEYRHRQETLGNKRPFLDGPHFEWVA